MSESTANAIRLTALVNENNAAYQFSYDASDRLVEEKRIDNLTRQFSYNLGGHLTRVDEIGYGERAERPQRSTEGVSDLGKYHSNHQHILMNSEYKMTGVKHFSRSNQSVYERVKVDYEFKKTIQSKYPGVVEHVQPRADGSFRGSSPPGMTWHHGDKPGSLQMVDRLDHQTYHKVYHPDGKGGRNKWGSGTACR